MSTSGLTLPHFLGIGAVKAGTTWLYRNVYKHPDIYMPAVKPVGYFDRHIHKPIETYSTIFKPGVDRVRGEFTASYSVLPLGTIKYIHQLMPDLRLIFLLREPKSRAWSEARMEFSVVRGLGAQPISAEAYCEFLRSDTCRARGDYRTILANWMTVFPTSQIFIGLLDDIDERPEELLGRLFDFLGVSSGVDYSSYPVCEKIFAGLPIPMPDRCRELLDRMYDASEIGKLGELVDIDLLHRWGYAT
jgi:Sulfotransferase domain